jgi:uncharacterized membrane protein/glutaredoxin
MAQSAKSKKPKSKTAERVVTPATPNWPVFALALLGMALTAYLTFTAWQGKLVAFCSAGGGCDAVLNSNWSTLLGMPTSFWGFLTYLLLAAIAWNKRSETQWKLAWIVAFFGTIYSLYLTSISVIVLHATCPYCLTSLALMTAIFITVTLQRPQIAGFSWESWLGKAAGTAAVLIVVLHAYYAGYFGKANAAEDPWISGLAEHLAQVNAKFYGASWCPHCAEQKEMFGGSAKRLPYIECSPGGPGTPQAAVCNKAGVESYPTWVINGQKFVGTQSLENLAQVSQFKFNGPRDGPPKL